MRSIGTDVHRSFAQIAVVESGVCRDEGRIGVRPEDLRAWAATLQRDDEVALEATTTRPHVQGRLAGGSRVPPWSLSACTVARVENL